MAYDFCENLSKSAGNFWEVVIIFNKVKLERALMNESEKCVAAFLRDDGRISDDVKFDGDSSGFIVESKNRIKTDTKMMGEDRRIFQNQNLKAT
jgi:hypothetical protein